MEAWGRFFFSFKESQDVKAHKNESWVTMLQKWSWIQSFYQPCHIPVYRKRPEPKGGGEHGSLMGCTVLFLPEEAEATKDSQKRCFNYTGPSINHAPCSWQLNPSQTQTGFPRPSQSKGWAKQQSWSQNTRSTWTPLQSPAATNRVTEQENHRGDSTLHHSKRYRNRDKWGRNVLLCVFVNVCANSFYILREILSRPCHSISQRTGLFSQRHFTSSNRLHHFKQMGGQGCVGGITAFYHVGL